MNTVEQIMTRDLVTVTMDTPLGIVQNAFDRHRFHHVVVVEDTKAVGVISDRDLLRTISPFVGKLAERKVDYLTMQKKAHQIMTRAIIACSPDDSVSDAACMMFKHNISCLPVLDENESCVGIVTLNDVLRWMLDHHYEGGASACKAA